MVLLDEGMEKLATEVASLLSQGQWGTDTTLPSPADTGLGTAVAATLKDLDTNVSGSSIQTTHTTTSTDANGSDLTEYEIRFSNGDSLNRVLSAAISKAASSEVITMTTVNFVRS